MKSKIFKILVPIFVASLIFTSCKAPQIAPTPSETIQEQEELAPSPAPITPFKMEGLGEYMPFQENTVFKYTSPDSEMGEMITFNDYIDNDNQVYQKRTLFNGDAIVETLKITENEITVENGYSMFNSLTNMSNEPPVENGIYKKIALIEPIKVGETWVRGTYDGINNITSTITAVDVDLKYEFGDYKAIEITSDYQNAKAAPNSNAVYKTKEYYGKGIGLLKIEQYIYLADKKEDAIFTWTLSEIGENLGFTNSYSFFYPVKNEDGSYKTAREKVSYTFKTNDDEIFFLNKGFRKYQTKDVEPLYGKETTILALDFDYTNQVATVDFSKELLDKIPTDAKHEMAILQSITNTFGVYYNVPHVIIKVDGAEYKSKNPDVTITQPMSILIEDEVKDGNNANFDQEVAPDAEAKVEQ